MTLNGNKVNLPKSVTIKFRDKFKIRRMMKREPLLFHVMLKQGFNWFRVAPNDPPTGTVEVIIDILTDSGWQSQTHQWLPLWLLLLCPSRGHHQCRHDHQNTGWHTHFSQRLHNPMNYLQSLEQASTTLFFALKEDQGIYRRTEERG